MPTKPKVEEEVEVKEEAVVEAKEKHQSKMAELIRKVLLASIGAIAIAQEEIETLINRLVERGEIAEKDGKKLIQEFMEKKKGKTAKFEEDINMNVEGALSKMNIPTKADIEALSQKITGLSKKIDELKKP
jgi:poly(hydroxyalkanoate) granule-associated protein